MGMDLTERIQTFWKSMPLEVEEADRILMLVLMEVQVVVDRIQMDLERVNQTHNLVEQDCKGMGAVRETPCSISQVVEVVSQALELMLELLLEMVDFLCFT
jgi:hypothetical protein